MCTGEMGVAPFSVYLDVVADEIHDGFFFCVRFLK